MTCGCNTYYPFVPYDSCGHGHFQTPSGPFPCVSPEVVVKGNFAIPGSLIEAVIQVNSSVTLYEGEGVKIGDGYYQITEIVDSTHIKIMHNGLGGDAGYVVVAQHPVYGCYQYPVVPVGKVALTEPATVTGLEVDAVTPIALSFINIVTQTVTYGYLGPNTISFDVNVVADIDNAPVWLSVTLPKSAAVTAGSAYYYTNTWLPLLCVVGSAAVFLAKPDLAAFSDGTSVIFKASGVYEISEVT